MRIALAAVVLAVIPACGLDLGLDEPLFSCEEPLFPGGGCVDANHPFDFTTDVDGVALGAETRVGILVHPSLSGFRIRSSDPTVADAELGDDDSAVVRGLAAGAARVEAVTVDGERVLDSVSITVAPVATAEFFYYPDGDDPVVELAGLVGSADTVYARFYAASGELLAVDGIVEYAVEGPLALGGDPEPRTSAFARAFWGEVLGEALTLSFEGEGAGRAIARTDDGGEFSLSIRGVAAAGQHSVEPDADLEIETQSLLFLRSVTGDGLPVAGVRGTWSLEPAGGATLTTVVDPASEATIEPTRAGTLTVRVALDGTNVSSELRVRDPGEG